MPMNGIAEGFTRGELEQFESILLERRRFLLGDIHTLQEAEARVAAETSMSTHLADLGSDRAASDVSLGRLESESAEIQQIDEALEHLRDGGFGLCENCDQPIAKARLEAIPYARLCLKCKSMEEGRG